MKIENLWNQQKNDFLDHAAESKDDQELVLNYQMLLEQLKIQTIAGHSYDEILRQQIILLFREASRASEILYVKGKPMVRYEFTSENKARSILMKVLMNPIPVCLALVSGFIFCLAYGMKKMPFSGYCCCFFAAALVLYIIRNMLAEKDEPVTAAAESVLKIDCLDSFITNQVRMLDQHIADLESLMQDVTAPLTETTLDLNTMSLCQTVWAVSNAGCPAELALCKAETLLQKNDISWVPYTPDQRNCFDIMPSKKGSRTVFPALRKTGDGTLIIKGQYLQKTE